MSSVFAELVGPEKETLDVGCGPGHISAFLDDNRLNVSGVDISPAMIEVAQSSFPEIVFRKGRLTDLPFADGSADAVVARHSIIHTDPNKLDKVAAEFARVLRDQGRLFVSFFASADPALHGEPFDHAVCTAYQLDPSTIADMLLGQGFNEEVRIVRQPRSDERQMPHACLIARRIVASRR